MVGLNMPRVNQVCRSTESSMVRHSTVAHLRTDDTPVGSTEDTPVGSTEDTPVGSTDDNPVDNPVGAMRCYVLGLRK